MNLTNLMEFKKEGSVMKFERTIDRQGRTLYKPIMSKLEMIAEGLLIIAFWLVMMTVFMVLAV